MKTKKKSRAVTVRRTRPRNSNLRNPAEWLVEALCGTKGYAGVDVNEKSALSVTAVFACVRAIAEDVAKVPLLLKRVKGDTKTEAVDHPLYDQLRQAPNPEMTSLTFRRTVTASALLWGNGYAEIQRAGSGAVIAQWPIHPSRVRAARTDGGTLFYKVQNDSGQFDDIPAMNMLHLPGIGAGVVGYSMLQLGKEAIGCAIAAERFAATFFGNGLRMSGVLEYPGKNLSDPAFKRIRDQWNAVHQGSDNAHKMAILEDGLKFHEMSTAPNDAQMLETRVLSVQEACRLFRIPPHKVFEMSRSTFGNIEHQSLEYVGDALYTWFALWDQEIKRKLILPREKDLFAEHAYQKLIQGDMAARSTRQRELFNVGGLNENEIRRENGLNPVGPSGDVYYVNGAMVPVESAILTGERKAEDQRLQTLKTQADAYGIAVRAGVITPNVDDEKFFRTQLGLPSVNKAVKQSWKKTDGVRQPITLQSEDGGGGAFGRGGGGAPADDDTEGTEGNPPGKSQNRRRVRAARAVLATQKLTALAPRHRDLLEDSLGRILTQETRRVQDAVKNARFREWAEKFYADHAAHVHAKIGGVIDAFTEAAWAILTDKPMAEAEKQAIFGATKEIAQRHVERSLAEMRNPPAVSEWATTRAKAQAAVEMDVMTDLIRNLAGVQ